MVWQYQGLRKGDTLINTCSISYLGRQQLLIRMFRAQRNMYLTLFSVLMMLVLRRFEYFLVNADGEARDDHGAEDRPKSD